MKIGMLAAVMAMGVMTGFDALNPYNRRSDPEPRYQSDEEVVTALEKAQAKRDRKAAKRLKSIVHK